MTRIDGFTDYIGPSGGGVSQGDLYLVAHPRMNDGNIHVSGTNLFLYLDGPSAGDGRWEYRGKDDIDMMCSGEMRLVAPKENIFLGSLQDITTSGADLYFRAYSPLGGIEVTTPGSFSLGNSLYSDLFTPDSIELYAKEGLIEIKAIASTWGGIGPWGIQFIDTGTNAGNIVLTTVEGKRITLNGSGLATLDDILIPVDQRPVEDHINPIDSNSGIYLGVSNPFADLYASGILLEPINDNIPNIYHPGHSDLTEGQLWHRSTDATNNGEGCLLHHTGSGIINLMSGSGVFFAYTVAGGSGVPSFPSYGMVPFTVSVLRDDHYHHDVNDSGSNTHVTVMTPGLYEISYSVTLSNSTTDRTTAQHFLAKNNVLIIGGSAAYSYHRTSAGNNGIQTGHSQVFAELETGDQISVATTNYGGAGTLSLYGQSSNLSVKFIRPSIY